MDKMLLSAKRIMSIRPTELGVFLKRLAGIARRKIQIDDLFFYIDPVTNFGYRLLFYGHYEPDVEETLKRILNDGDVFIDLGANEGYFSVIAGKAAGKTGHVYCIEPQERMWPIIFRNMYYNGIGHYTLLPYAIGEDSGDIELTLSPSINTGASSAVSSMRTRLWRRQTALMRPLDEICTSLEIEEIKLMKVDIEGFELNALRSASVLLSRHKIKNVLIEIHPRQLKQLHQSTNEIFELFKKNGYSNLCTEGVNLFSCE